MSSNGHQVALLPFGSVSRSHALGLLRRAVGLASLGGIAAGSLIIVTAAASYSQLLVPARWGGLPGWLRGPLSDTGFLLPPSRFAYVFLFMTACYLAALLCAPALGTRWIVAAICVVHVIFFLGPPLISADIFAYLDWARMGPLYGLNPYATDSGTVVSDPVHGFVRWHSLTSPYGPLFTLGTYGLVPLGLPGSFWALKLLTTLSSLGCVALIWRCAVALERSPRFGILLYGLNPAVLVYTIGGFHNDAIMMLGVLGAVYLVVTGREAGAGVVGALAVGVKSSAGLVMPFLLIGSPQRRRTLVAGVAAGVAILLVGLIAFGSHALDFVNVLGTQQEFNSGSSVPAQLGAWFGWTGSPPTVRLVASLAGAAAILFLLWRAWRGSDWIECAGWATLAVMVTSSWLLAWYVVWLVPLASLARSRLLQAGAVAMTLFVILVRMVPFLD